MAKTLKNVIDFCDGIKPNSFTGAQKTQWINEAEGMVETEVMLIALEDAVQYDYTADQNTELLVPPPHDKIYISYLCAMIDFANGEYSKYNNTMELFNGQFSEYMSWYARTNSPADEQCGFLGYYLSAYGIAVKHGYAGSETEWLDSLKGESGEQGEQGIQGEPGEGVPSGGTTGQILKKTSGSDYDTEWANSSGMTDEEREQLEENTENIALLMHKCAEVTAVSVNPSVCEMGSSANITITATISKQPVSLEIKRGNVSIFSATYPGDNPNPMSISEQDETAVTTNTTYTVTATDDLSHIKSKPAAVYFCNGVYYGAAASTNISNLTKSLQNNRAKTFTVNAGAGEYIYYALPSRYGTPVFHVGGFEGGFSLVATTSYTNPSGYTEDYAVWRSDNPNLGAQTVIVT